MDKQRMIDGAVATLHAQIERAKAIGRLPEEALTRRPAPGQWNVLEVFAHLVLSSGVYERGLREVFRRKAAGLPNAATFTPGLLGGYFTNGMRPKADGRIGWKMRTMRMFDPARQQGASLSSITEFIALCEGFLDLLAQARTTDLDRLRVTSSLGPVIRFKAGDAFRFPVAHQERHFLQIERLLKT